jgi:hypothetical protein
MALVNLIPVGASWRVAAEGVSYQYTTQLEAETQAALLRAQGKTPVVSTYNKTDDTPLLPINPGGKKK